MTRDFKKIFFCTLLTVVFIISNLIGLKYTAFGNLLISANFIIYPFIPLCVLLIMDIGEKKETFNVIIGTVFIQAFLLLIYLLVVNFNVQMVIPDLAYSINNVFAIDGLHILTSLIAFITSNYVVIYLYEYFKNKRKKFLGVFLGTFLSLIISGLIYNLICYYGYEKSLLVNLIKSHIVVSFVSSIVVTILFYLLKERDCIYTEDETSELILTFEEDMKNNDKTFLEVIMLKERDESDKKPKRKSSSSAKKVTDNKKKTNNKSKNTVKK